jgi:NUMOD4 motif.
MKGLQAERWYHIPQYRDHYQVSTHGRVRSLARVDDNGRIRPMKLLRFTVRPNGRRYFNLSMRGVARSLCASVLMAQAYGILNPRCWGYVIHRNRDNADFRLRNLAWVTLAQQRIHDGRKRSSCYYGVTRLKRSNGMYRWIAQLTTDGEHRELGYFATPEEAAYAYDREVTRLGVKRPLNGLARPKVHEPQIKSLPGEVWCPFPGAERTHVISNRGRVRTLAYRTRQGQRVRVKLRKITVDRRGCRTIMIAGRRYGIATVLMRIFSRALS